MPAQQNVTDARLNLIGASYGLSTGTSIVFTAYQGFTGANNAGMDTGFNPATSPSPNLTQNSGTVGVWIYSGIDPGVQLGAAGFGYVNITALSGGNFFGYIFPSGGGNSVASPGTTGYFAVDRTSSSAGTTGYYWNSTHIVDQGPTSQAPNSADIFLLNLSNTVLSEAHFGGSLGASGQLALYNRLRTYMTAVGVP